MITSATQKVDPQVASLLAALTPGQRIRITQRVRVGARIWPAKVEGDFRGVDYLATGLATQRVREDDIVVPVVHFYGRKELGHILTTAEVAAGFSNRAQIFAAFGGGAGWNPQP